jgi:excisionase family DNA binding protein
MNDQDREEMMTSTEMVNRQADRWLTPGEVARMFRVNPKTVSRWADSGRLPSRRTFGGHRRFPESEVRKLLDQIGREPGAY